MHFAGGPFDQIRLTSSKNIIYCRPSLFIYQRNVGMQTDVGIGFLKAMLGNPVTRRILMGMNRQCKKCGENRLEVALEIYVGSRQEACRTCRLAEIPLSAIIALGARAFGVSEGDIRRTFGDPHWRKGLISVVNGIANFGVSRPFVPGAPFQVVWDVTYGCNLRCQHCYASAGKARADELSTDEALMAIDQFAAMGVPIIAFSGGEPLVRSDILQLIRHASDKGIFVAIATNGTLITKEKARELKEAGLQYLQISVDGAKAETHDTFRGIPGSFDRTLEGIRSSVAEGFFVNISTTVTKRNVDEVPRIIDMCRNLGVDWFMAYNFIPAGRGKDMIDIDLSPEEREGLLKVLYKANSGSGMQVLTTAPQFARVALQQCSGSSSIMSTHFYNQAVDKNLLGLSEFIGGCGAGRFYMALRANGNIDPCVFFPKTVGNIRHDDLKEIWLHDPLFTSLRNKDLLKDNCGHCEYRYHCGGCRARANGYFNDPLAADPGCIRNLDQYNEMVRKRSDLG